MSTKVIRSMYTKNVKFQFFGFHYFWGISRLIFLNKKERSKLRFNDTRKLWTWKNFNLFFLIHRILTLNKKRFLLVKSELASQKKRRNKFFDQKRKTKNNYEAKKKTEKKRNNYHIWWILGHFEPKILSPNFFFQFNQS